MDNYYCFDKHVLTKQRTQNEKIESLYIMIASCSRKNNITKRAGKKHELGVIGQKV